MIDSDAAKPKPGETYAEFIARRRADEGPKCVWQPCLGAPHSADVPLCRFHLTRAWQEAQKLIGGGLYESQVIRSTPANGRVYFVRFGDRIKIGWSGNLPRRMKALPHDEVLGSVPGTLSDEQRWHLVFADLREQGEWFRDTPELRKAIADAISAQS